MKRPTDHFKLISKYKNIDECHQFLDFGAGQCLSSKFFNENGAGNEGVTCFDKSADTESICLENGFHFINDLDQLPKNLYDLIYSSHSLEHVVSVIDVLDQFKRSLKIGGLLFIEVPNISSIDVLKAEYHPPHTYAFSTSGLVSLIERLGFELLFVGSAGLSWTNFLDKKINPDEGMYLRILAKKS